MATIRRMMAVEIAIAIPDFIASKLLAFRRQCRRKASKAKNFHAAAGEKPGSAARPSHTPGLT
jgi:hypothetical protein